MTNERTTGVVERFNATFNRHDVDAIMALITEDCVFENTTPPPNGERFADQAAVRACWERLCADAPQAVFSTEDLFISADRAVVRWSYRWAADEPGRVAHVRGVDLLRAADDKIADKLVGQWVTYIWNTGRTSTVPTWAHGIVAASSAASF
ncbi:MAG TPA: nuclear transport factor 2 family protein [Chloroflexota bacterium]|jgi:ketosteroid isomerase-like protein